MYVGGPLDGGVDLIATRRRRLAFVQVKRWTHPVGSSNVRDFYGAMNKAGADEGLFVTTSRFTAEARAFARGLPIQLIDGDALINDWLKPSGRHTTMKISTLLLLAAIGAYAFYVGVVSTEAGRAPLDPDVLLSAGRLLLQHVHELLSTVQRN